MRKPTIWVPTRSDTNRSVQSQKQARSLKFWIKKKECTIHAGKSKALISFAVTAKLICAFVFTYVDCWFSHAAAHLYSLLCLFTLFYPHQLLGGNMCPAHFGPREIDGLLVPPVHV